MGRKYYRIKENILYFGFPALIYVIFIIGGFLLVFIESLGYIPTLDMTETSIVNYINVTQDRDFFQSLALSLYLSTISTTLSIVIGVYLAQYIIFSESKLLKHCVLRLSNILIILPYLFAILLVIWMFSDSGLLARILYILGFSDDIGLLYGDLGFGMIASFVIKGAAFVTVYVYNVMSKVKKDYFVLASSMGVSKKDIVMSIYIPICRNTIIWSSAILFAYTLGSYEVPMLLSNVNQDTLSTEMYSLYTSSNITDFPRAMATNIIILVINVIFSELYAMLMSKAIKRGYE